MPEPILPVPEPPQGSHEGPHEGLYPGPHLVSIEATLIGFAQAARHGGLPVTADRTQSYLQAAATAGIGDRQGLYWAGRATLTTQPDHAAVYDAVFAAWFGGAVPPSRNGRSKVTRRPIAELDPAARAGDPRRSGDDDPEAVPATASDAEVLGRRDIADLTPAQRRRLAQLFGRLQPVAPRRPAVRRRPDRRGELDLRRMLRDEVRRSGEPGPLRYHRRTTRPRRVVLIVDVSGSMAAYADSLLRLAHVWVRSAPRSTEVFTVGTRLTRVSAVLRSADPDLAVRGASEQVPDWSGGTRLGQMLGAFLARWGQRGVARGAVVVVFSDGWERGDPALLADQMQRLHRLAHRVVWVNPHRAKAGYRPVQGGIVAALPYVDDFLAGHSLAAFAEVMEVVARA